MRGLEAHERFAQGKARDVVQALEGLGPRLAIAEARVVEAEASCRAHGAGAASGRARRRDVSALEDRGFELATSVGGTKGDLWTCLTLFGLGAIVSLWHGTMRGGFKRFARSPTYFALRPEHAMEYTRSIPFSAQRDLRRGMGTLRPEIIEAAVDPGRTLDIERPEDLEDFKGALAEMFQHDPEARPSLRAILEQSWSRRDGVPHQAVPFNLVDNGLGAYLRKRGYDSAYVSEGRFQSLAVFDPKGRTKILARRRA